MNNNAHTSFFCPRRSDCVPLQRIYIHYKFLVICLSCSLGALHLILCVDSEGYDACDVDVDGCNDDRSKPLPG
jgi:hypothetical protein